MKQKMHWPGKDWFKNKGTKFMVSMIHLFSISGPSFYDVHDPTVNGICDPSVRYL